MKILHIVPYYKPAYVYGGPIVSISRLAKQLSQENHHVTVWTTIANGDKLLEVQPNVEVNIDGIKVYYFALLGSTFLFFSPRLLIFLYKKIKSFDIIHIHTWWNLTALGAALICLLKGVKPVLSPRGMLSSYSFDNRKSFLKRLFHSILGRRLLENTILHATAKQELDECHDIIPTWKGFVIPNIVALNNITIPTESFKDTFNLIFLSRIHHKKGIELLLESLSSVNFKWRLSIVGKGDDLYLQTLKELTTKWNINHQIDWLDWADGNKKYELLANADLMVLPSFNENFANTVLESLSVGTPVLVTNRVGLSDYVEKEDLGWVTDLNIDSIRKALEQAYQQKEKRQRIRQAAPEKIRQDFAPEKIAQQYITAYQTQIATSIKP